MGSMFLQFDVEKAIQATGALLRRDGKRMSRIRLLMLLYLAERQSLEQCGMPILGSRLVAMKQGPLHKDVFDLINGVGRGEPIWSSHFKNVGRENHLEVEPDVGRLSRREIGILNKVSDEVATLNDWELVNLTHGFAEWKRNYPDPAADSCCEIPLGDMIDAVGRSADKESILQAYKNRAAYARFFAELAPVEPQGAEAQA